MTHRHKVKTPERFERAISSIKAGGDLNGCVDRAIQLLVHVGMADSVVGSLLRDMENRLRVYERAGVKHILSKRRKGARVKTEYRKGWAELRARLEAVEQKSEDYREMLLQHGIKVEV